MIPKAGDIVWVEFDPTMGSGQAGRRPALVLTPFEYHELSSRALVCPITTDARVWPFNVALPAGLRTKGFVLVDQLRSVDRRFRIFRTIETAPPEILHEVRERLNSLLGAVDRRA